MAAHNVGFITSLGQPRNLHLQLQIIRTGSLVCFCGVTQSFNREEFAFYSERPFSIGERVRFLALLPDPLARSDSSKGLCLDGEAEIVRIDAYESASKLGVFCRIHGYRIAKSEQITAARFLS